MSDLGAQNSPNLEGCHGFSKIRTPKSTHPDPDFGNLFCVFWQAIGEFPIFSIRDSGKLLGEFERTRSFFADKLLGISI